MIDFMMLHNSCGTCTRELTPKQQQIVDVFITGFLFLWLILFVWALNRAKHCSSPTPDSRAIHYGFAIISPPMYLLCSYFVDGFCPV